MPFDGAQVQSGAYGNRARIRRVRRSVALDFETFSDVQLVGPSSVGIWNYSSHASTEALMVAYQFDGGKVKQADLTCEEVPADLEDALLDERVNKWAFNAAFERLICRNTLKIATPYKGWRCTMALANQQSFTGDLLQIGKAMGLAPENLKDKEGSRLIKMFCAPQRLTKKNIEVRRDSTTDREDWEKFLDYNRRDVVAEESIRSRLLRFEMPELEWEIYEIDQQINDTGMPVNRQFVEQAEIMSDIRKMELFARMKETTGLKNPNSAKQLVPWLKEGGYPFDDLQKATVTKVLKADAEIKREIRRADKMGVFTDLEPLLLPEVTSALRLRQQHSRTSVKKYPAILRRLAVDDNLRHAYQYGGAARTLRWAGRGPQPHNLTRTPKVLEAEKGDATKLEMAADIIESGDYKDLRLFAAEPMTILAGSVRSSFQAHAGYELRVCDLSAIESAVLAWLSRCKRMLKVFKDGRDPYKDFATELYHKAYADITGSERTICKPAVLGCGYQLGGGTTKNGKRTGLYGYAENMGVDITEAEATSHVKLFRSMYSEIPDFWYAVDKAAKTTVLKGIETDVNGLVKFSLDGPYLKVTLPSGRPMYYYKPRIVTKEYEGKDGSTFTRRVLSYMGKSQTTHQWTRVFTSGGKQTENIVQAVARDILALGMVRAHRDGFNIVGSVHDEIITHQRVGDNYFTLERLRGHMIGAIEWATGLPLGAAGYAAGIYRKD